MAALLRKPGRQSVKKLTATLFLAFIAVFGFKALAQPTITSFSPASGSIGSIVTINGTGFDGTAANNIVFFGAVRASVKTATTTQLSVVVPAGASYEPIRITVGGLSVDSTLPFFVTFPSNQVMDVNSFSSNVNFSAGWYSNHIAIGDLDGDGKADMVVTNQSANTVSLLRNTSSAQSINSNSFAPKVDFATGTQPMDVVVEDLDDDGKLDIAVVNQQDNSVSIYRNVSTPGVIDANSLSSRVDFTIGSFPAYIAAKDLDLDGKPDLAVSNGSGVSVLRNTSASGTINASSFAAAVSFGSGGGSVLLADVNSDGKPEIILASTSVSVLQNNSTKGVINSGSFAAAISFATAGSPWRLIAGDIDGDTNRDIIAVCAGTTLFSVLRNTGATGAIGSGSFDPKVDFSTGADPRAAAVGDLDGDGKLDVAVVNYSDNTVSVYKNKATAGAITSSSLASKVDFPTGPDPIDVAIEDLDNDGKYDIAVVDYLTEQVSVFRNNAPSPPVISSFSPESGPIGTQVTLSGNNFNPVASKNVVYFGATLATVTSASPTQLVVTVPAGATYRPISISTNGLSALSAKPFVVKFTSSQIINSSSFSPAFSLSTGNSPQGIAIGDLDRDGKPDIVIANQGSNTISVYRNKSTAGQLDVNSFELKVDLNTGSYPRAVSLADIDNDGLLDIAAVTYFGNKLSIYRNVSSPGSITTGSFAAPVDFDTYIYPQSLSVADFDSDGKLDIAVATVIAVSVYKNISTPGVINTSSLAPRIDLLTASGEEPNGMTVGDLDGDNRPDIISRNGSNGTNTISIFKNLSSVGSIDASSFASYVDYAFGQVSNIGGNGVLISDLNGDNEPDIAVANVASNSVSFFGNNGTPGQITTGSFGAKVDITTNAFPGDVAASDLDGDGQLDIAAIGSTSKVALLKNVTNGAAISASTFATPVSITGGNAYGIAIGDLDGDGKPDLVVPNTNTNAILIIRNINTLKTPASPSATSITQTGFTLSWTASPGATNYSIDMSTDNFTTILPDYNNLTVSGITKVITVSKSGTYYWRVRANNSSGSSTNTATVTVTTVPSTPVAIAPSNKGQTGFTANWNSSDGASGYLLDVATDSLFTVAGILSNYSNLSVSSTTTDITGLTGGNKYYYRVRASNATGTSPNSNVIPITTVPPDPVSSAATDITQTSFTAHWSSSTSATKYILDVTTDAGFTSNIPSSPITVGDLQSIVVSDLTPNTKYFYRVRASNSSGMSGNSASQTLTTASLLKINSEPAASSVFPASGQAVETVNITGGAAPLTVSLKYRAISANAFISLPALDKGSGNYEATITDAMLDELGAEFYFEATDAGNVTIRDKDNAYVYKSVGTTNSVVPFTSNFDGTSSTYEMFSVPFELKDKTVTSVFAAMGAPDKTTWRLFHYQGGKYIEYPDNISNIDIGKGYWFNTIQKTDIAVGTGVVTSANQDASFTMPVEKGWNQIGNPFPFTVDWAVVKSAAANALVGVNSLFTFSGGYSNTRGFAPWTGGFVYCDNEGTLTIPVTAKCSGCRVSGVDMTSDIDEEAWIIPLTLTFNDLEQVSSVGMHPEAKMSKDKFDEITVPRFMEYLEMNTQHNEFVAHHFSTDVIPTNNTAGWQFTLASNHPDGNAALSWDQSTIAMSTSHIALLDLQEATIIDMKLRSGYTFKWSEGRQFKILYSKEGDILPGVTMLGNAYPNPFTSDLSIPVFLEEDQSEIYVKVYDLLGRNVKTISNGPARAGVHTLHWDGQNDSGSHLESGLYIYQLLGDKGIISTSRRIIKR